MSIEKRFRGVRDQNSVAAAISQKPSFSRDTANGLEPLNQGLSFPNIRTFEMVKFEKRRAAGLRMKTPIFALRSVIAIYLSAFGFSCVPARADPVRVDDTKIVDVGTYDFQILQVEGAATPSGTVQRDTDIKLVSGSTTICLKPGVTFGLRYIIEGDQSGAQLPIHMVVRFPEGGMKNPSTGQMFFRAEHTVLRNIGKTWWAGYTIGGGWGAVAGIWTVELWYQDRQLLTQEFDIEKRACDVS